MSVFRKREEKKSFINSTLMFYLKKMENIRHIMNITVCCYTNNNIQKQQIWIISLKNSQACNLMKVTVSQYVYNCGILDLVKSQKLLITSAVASIVSSNLIEFQTQWTTVLIPSQNILMIADFPTQNSLLMLNS